MPSTPLEIQLRELRNKELQFQSDLNVERKAAKAKLLKELAAIRPKLSPTDRAYYLEYFVRSTRAAHSFRKAELAAQIEDLEAAIARGEQ